MSFILCIQAVRSWTFAKVDGWAFGRGIDPVFRRPDAAFQLFCVYPIRKRRKIMRIIGENIHILSPKVKEAVGWAIDVWTKEGLSAAEKEEL